MHRRSLAVSAAEILGYTARATQQSAFPSKLVTGKMLSISAHCCSRMDSDLTRRCDPHRNRHDFPDAVIDVIRGRNFLIVHDGCTSSVAINFCPWCGTKLPKHE